MTPTNELPTQLREFNRWRRGNETLEQPHPKDIGVMIDEAADRLEQLERELEQERQDRWQADIKALRALGERNDARAEVEQIKTILAGPFAVHLNMMHGTIKWTPANLRALLGDTEP
jgi:hypothetical protein